MREHEMIGLLEKYWQGETTIEEEKALKKYFSRNTIPEAFSEEEDFFRSVREFQQNDFGKGTAQKNSRSIVLAGSNLLRAAVIICIGTLCIFLLNNISGRLKDHETQIRQQARNDLYSISEMLNQGYDNLATSTESMEQATINIK